MPAVASGEDKSRASPEGKHLESERARSKKAREVTSAQIELDDQERRSFLYMDRGESGPCGVLHTGKQARLRGNGNFRELDTEISDRRR